MSNPVFFSFSNIMDNYKFNITDLTFDEKIFGIKVQLGSIFGLFAPIGVGKTEFALDLMYHFVNQANNNYIIYCQYENDIKDIVFKLKNKGRLNNELCNIIGNRLFIGFMPTIQEIEDQIVMINSLNIDKEDKNHKILVVLDYLQEMALYEQSKLEEEYSLNFIVNKIMIALKFLKNKYNNIAIFILTGSTREFIYKIAKAGKTLNDLDSSTNLKELSDVIYMFDYAYCMYYKNKYGKVSLDCNCNDDDNEEKFLEVYPFKFSFVGKIPELVEYYLDKEAKKYGLIVPNQENQTNKIELEEESTPATDE